MPTLSPKPIREHHEYMPSSGPLDTEVRSAMTPGVVSITETATLLQGYRALVAHEVHSVLVIGRNNGKPLGWVTARGLLGHITDDSDLCTVGDAITHPPASIQPGATLREALTALAQPGVSQLLVARRPDVLPEGVLSDLDVIAASAI